MIPQSWKTSATPTQRFQTFVTRLRPHRIAVLTNIAEGDWQRSCLRIIEFLSQIWGGAHSLIVPTDGETISDTFWEMLSSFDADIIFYYKRTGFDFSIEKPERAEEYMAARIRDMISQGFDSVRADEEVRRDFPRCTLDDGFEISETLTKQIHLRLSPLHIEDYFRINYFSANDAPSYPLTAVADVIPAIDSGTDHVFDVINNAPDTLSTPPPLWLLAEAGIANATYQRVLDDKGVKTVPKFLNTDGESDLIRWGINPSVAFGRNSPFALSLLGLRSVRATRSMRHEVPSILIVGETLADFCLYYGLSRLHGRAVWAPDWFMPSPTAYPQRLLSVARKLSDMGRHEHSKGIAIMSASLPRADLEALVQTLTQPVQLSQFSVSDALDPVTVRALVEHPTLWYIAKNTERMTTHMLLNDQLPGTFESPVPSILNEIDSHNHRWLVELMFDGHLTPRHPALGGSLVTGPNVGEVRAATNGATYMCPGAFVMGSDIELQILRPTIAVPDAERIFRIALASCGYECKVSDKGAYAQATVEKFGGLRELAQAFRHGHLWALFQKFLDEKKPGDGVHDDGVFLRDKRRYLNFACFTKILGDAAFAGRIIDEYIAKGILYRGFVLHCKRCDDTSWFSVDELSQQFTCRRCGTAQQYERSSWRHPDEPSWFYKLDEIVYQTVVHDGHVPILALDTMRAKSRGSFIFSPELAIRSFGASEWELEIDIACIANGKMFIGEAKSNASLKTDTKSPKKIANKYRHLAEVISASGVIFSTSQLSWDATSTQAIDEQFAPYPYLTVRRLCEADLYAQPPA
ncbi:hypothetical protein [Granulicella paludicola]|uniref:hypothetical protein n=1 Tax=Granulicella paludicola TaxID=474951 RepID=UPI0021E0E474|nr:hypothetical protein [Granulicella paludicola]